MAHLTQSTFSSYALTPEELSAGSQLSGLQELVLRNLMAEAAQLKLNLRPDPNNYPAFISEESYISGQIALIQALLDTSESVRKGVLLEAQAQAAVQNQ